MKLIKISALLAVGILVISCATDSIIPEPQYNPKEPSLTRLMLYLGKDMKDGLFKRFKKKYQLFQKKYGKEGLIYPPDRAYVYHYYKNRIVKLVIVVQQPFVSSRLKPYTGPLPFNLYRRDTYDSIVKKFGKPSAKKLNNTIIEYKKKKLQIKFRNGTIATLTISAE